MDTKRIAQALSDPVRQQILKMLANSHTACCPVTSQDDSNGLCNCEIMLELGMIQSRVSYHMKELVETGLVNEEPRGKWKYYFLNRQKIMDYLDQIKRDFNLE